MAKTEVSSVDVAMGENSYDLDRFCYPWVDLYLAQNFIWIGSISSAQEFMTLISNSRQELIKKLYKTKQILIYF